MNANPYQPPGANSLPNVRSEGGPAVLALMAGIAGWVVLEVVCRIVPGPRLQWWPGVLLTVAVFGVIGLLVGWHCRGRVMLRWLLMTAGATLAVLGVALLPAVGWSIGNSANASWFTAVVVSWFALSLAGALKPLASLRRSVRQR